MAVAILLMRPFSRTIAWGRGSPHGETARAFHRHSWRRWKIMNSVYSFGVSTFGRWSRVRGNATSHGRGRGPGRDITIMGRPIDLMPLESFRVEIRLPGPLPGAP
ncbi:MAG: hypothetical protein IT371_30280 [Deltaproteobacteria bacterium]|nr:hypothetical protein [Deltaproteobacteria bacterium]